MTNVTINIKNCGCGGGKTVTDTPFSVGDGASGEWGDPASPSGPPEDFFIPTSGLSDRQCKAAVWLYDWLEWGLNYLANTTAGNIVLNGIRLLPLIPGSVGIKRVIATAIPTIIGLMGGPDPTDAAIGWLSWSVSGSLLAVVGGWSIARTQLITQDLIGDALAKIQAQQDEIICTLAQAPNAEEAFKDLQKSIQSLELTFEQKQLVVGFIPRGLFNLLFFTSDYWPTFDNDYLSGITTTCCGGVVNGDPLTQGTTLECQASYYIIDQLANTMDAVTAAAGVWYNVNPFDNDRPDVYQWLDANLNTPAQVEQRAYNYPGYLNALTEIIYSKFILTIHFANLDEFGDFAAYITANRDTLASGITGLADQDAVYTALQPLRDWITNNVTDTTIRDYMLQGLDALIAVREDGQGLLDLMFYQEGAVSNYALADCVSGGASGFLTAIDNVTILKSNTTVTDQANFIGANDDNGMEIKSAASAAVVDIEADFGQVYANAIKLEMRVQSVHTHTEGRRLYKCAFDVKEDVNDSWQSVGTIYFDGADLNDFAWHNKPVSFSARNIRYVRMRFDRGTNAFGIYGKLYFDSLKVVQQ